MAKGTTIVTIEHPNQDISLLGLGTSNFAVGQAASTLQTILNGAAIGSVRPGTRVQVTQGAVQAAGYITLSNVGGAASTGSFSFSSATGTTTATLNGVAFSQTTGTDTQRATQLASQITTSTNPAIQGMVTAVRSGDDVEVTAAFKGLAGDAIPMAVSGTGLTASGAGLDGGIDGLVSVTIDGLNPVAADTTNLTDAAAALAVAASLNGDPGASSLVTASGAGNRVNLKAVEYGTSGNAIGIVALTDTGTATRSGPNLTGGSDGTSSYLERP